MFRRCAVAAFVIATACLASAGPALAGHNACC